jgi:NAD(P)H-hydrate epimerase
MITAQEVNVLDKNSEYFDVPAEKLMENAGFQISQFIQKELIHPKILFLCGTGNNGGDGFVAARYLSKNLALKLFLIGEEKDIKTSISRMNFIKLKNLPLKIFDIRSINKLPNLIEKSNVIIDSMLGIGLYGDLKEPYDKIVNLINKSKNKTIISVDVPTGLGASIQVKADYTITFHDKKQGMNKNSCGKIIVKDIGIPTDASNYVGPGDLSIYYPHPKKDSHKGDNGRVLIIGGGPYTGAPTLAGLAALRTGADLVSIATSKNVANIISSYSPNLIVHPLQSENYLTKSDVNNIKYFLDKADSVIIGPGLGLAKETGKAVVELIKIINKKSIPMVIDADAIKALKNHKDYLKNSKTVITPHAMEFYDFTSVKPPDDLNKRKKIVFNWAKKLNISFFLKGPIDILTDGKEIKSNIIHNEAMTVGGTGDVLSGVIGALLAKNATPIQSIRIAAFLNGEAGNQAFKKKSYGLLATDIIEEIPIILKKYL